MGNDTAVVSLTEAMLESEPAAMVAPARPTEPPTTVELSNLDHMLNFYSSAVLFYHASRSGPDALASDLVNTEVPSVVRRALQELLTYYPAAAGRLRVNRWRRRLEIECNDQGVQFVSACANVFLSDLGDVSLAHPSLDLLFPSIPSDLPPESLPIVAIQVTTFKCGGFAVSLASNHVYFDGHSAAVFMQNLASIARGKGIAVAPDTVSRRERMKPRSTPGSTSFEHPYVVKKEDQNDLRLDVSSRMPPLALGNVTRIALPANDLQNLRLDMINSGLHTCTRYEALVALLWKARAESLHGVRSQHHAISEVPLRIPVNLRGKMMSLSRGYVGNGLCPVTISAPRQELCESPLRAIVRKVQEAIQSVTPAYMHSLLDYLESGEGPLGCIPNEVFFGMASIVGLPFYDTDFGWGCPTYCGFPGMQVNNRLYILDGGLKGGWNVIVVFTSKGEHDRFLKALEPYVTFST